MNAVEIEQAVSDLVEAPFDREAFAFSFLEAFGNKATTIKKLKMDRGKKASSNHSDFEGGVLQRSNIHLMVCDEGTVTQSLKALVESKETAKRKCKYALATDGKTIEAENLVEGETLACDYERLADNFGFFLALAGITTVKEIRNNAFDIKATSRLNRLYVELLQHNPEWDTAERREEMNHFFARLIFCFFAEDTGIFNGNNLFTKTVEQMSDGTNAHEILTECFRAMNTPPLNRSGFRQKSDRGKKAESDSQSEKRNSGESHYEETPLRPYATQFPYVNGGLFSGSPTAPKFTKIARSYLIHVGHLDWTQINPDIFGSMIQAVADDEERGALGMHYTSVPNILKVLNPLFLDDLRTKLEEAGDNKRKLLNLRGRLARIRVFDPACGSGNFLVIAYKEMREIEATINKLRGEEDRRSDIPLTNFRGIELRSFSAEIARLALIIAEYQCDVLYRGQKLALLEFLPLDAKNWITCGNALRLDWLKICPPTGTGVKVAADDLFSTPLDQTEMDFENEGGEIFICGNPPYLGKGKISAEVKDDMRLVFEGRTKKWGYVDLVGAWFVLASDYCRKTDAMAALVATNSVVMGRQAISLWPIVIEDPVEICFAHVTFPWSNNAARNAAVMVVIIGLGKKSIGYEKKIYENDSTFRRVSSISQYLTAGVAPLVDVAGTAISKALPEMNLGNKPNDGKQLRLGWPERMSILKQSDASSNFIRPFFGSDEYNSGKVNYCLWIADDELDAALQVPPIRKRIKSCRETRLGFADPNNKALAKKPHQMREFNSARRHTFIVPISTSEKRKYIPCGLLPPNAITSSQAFSIFDQENWVLALLVSKMHFVWVATICGKFKLDYRYSNDLGWNTFPLPALSQANKSDLTERANEILLLRESHFPATIGELYDDSKMPLTLRAAHERNDETLERIYIGRRFKNDTERLEKLFEMYTKMTANP